RRFSTTKRVDRAQRLLEPRALFGEERRTRIVRRGEVRVDGVHREVRAGEELGKRAAKIVVAKPEPVHAGVDLQMVVNLLPVARRGGLNGAGSRRRGDRRREAAVEQAVELADGERAERENVG